MDYDIVGDADIEAILAGEDDEMGAAKPRGAGAGRPQGPALAKKGKPRFRYFMLPINSAAVTTGASADATARPQQPFKPVRLVLSNPTLWLITRFTIGNKPQTVASGTIPGDAFQGTSTDVLLDCDTSGAGVDIVLGLTNTSSGTLTQYGVFFGPSAQ